MHFLLSQIYHNILYGTACIILLLVLNKAILKDTWLFASYYLWLIPIFAFLNPMSFTIGLESAGVTGDLFVGMASKYKWAPYAFLLCWACGVIIILVRCFIKRKEALFLLLHNLRQPTSNAVSILEQCKAELNIKAKVQLGVNSNIESPLVLFSATPTIILPVQEWKPAELRLAILHELYHLKSHDGLIKGIGYCILILFWWNPFVHCMQKQMVEYCELVCDQRMLSHVGEEDRLAYAKMILNCAKRAPHHSYDSVSASLGAGFFQRRFSFLMAHKEQKMRVGILLIAILLLAGSFLTIREDAPLTPPFSSQMKNIEIVQRFDGYYDVYSNGNMIAYGIDEALLSMFTE